MSIEMIADPGMSLSGSAAPRHIVTRTLLLVFACSTGCAYEAPVEGPVATVVVASASTYNDVEVDYCLDPECDRTRRIGLLAGTRFLRMFEGSSHVQEEYSDRRSHTFVVPAGQPSTIRFQTTKDVIRFGDEPRVERTYTDFYGLNITLIRTRTTYIESEEVLQCDAFVKIEPESDSTVELVHDHDDETEECSVTEVADAAAYAGIVAAGVPEVEEPQAFYEISLGDTCTAQRESLRLSGYRANTPVLFIQVSRLQGHSSADLEMTKFSSLGEPLFGGTGQLGLDSWSEAVHLADAAGFWNLPSEGARSDSAHEVWQVEACIGGIYHTVRSAPRSDPALRELINFLANTEY